MTRVYVSCYMTQNSVLLYRKCSSSLCLLSHLLFCKVENFSQVGLCQALILFRPAVFNLA